MGVDQRSGNDVIEFPSMSTTIVRGAGATVNILNGPGRLLAVYITGGTAGTVDIYDDPLTTNNPITKFDSTNTTEDYLFDVDVTYGLTVITGADVWLTVKFIADPRYVLVPLAV